MRARAESADPPGVAARFRGAAREGPVAVLASVVFLGLAPVPVVAQGQEAATLDEGTYRITVNGRPVGSEAFALRRQGRNVRAVGRVRLDTAVEALPPMEAWLQADRDFRPSLFRIEPSGDGPASVTAVREGDRIRVRSTTAEGERYREFLAPEGLALFDPRLAHHWDLVLRPLDAELASGGSVAVPAILPARPERVRLEIRRGTSGSVEVAGRRVTATAHEVTGGVRATVWTDGSGRVVKLELPDRGLVTERIRGEGAP